MSFDHHGKPKESELMKRLRQETTEKQNELMNRFFTQRDGKANRQWPDGRVSGDDDGDTTFIISSDPDKGLVRVEFATPTAWVAMPPQQAMQFAELLIKHARAITKEPISLNI